MTAAAPLRGDLRVPGDKSISHRAVLFAALASGETRIRGLLRSDDVLATVGAVRALGAEVEERGEEWVVTPPAQLTEPPDVIDCGNSGTTMRLLTGVLAAQPFLSVLTGDRSLRQRPMGRVLKPLSRMGARVDGRSDGQLPPLVIRGGALRAHDHDLPVASAQVKSALLLAGLRCGAAVREPRRSRDHTERMLMAMGVTLRAAPGGWLLSLPRSEPLDPIDWSVPGDLSSAAFLLAAAALIEGSDITIRGVGLNPTRTGFIDILREMGARIEVEEQSMPDEAERHGTIRIRGSELEGIEVDGELALRALDELPLVAVLAACAEGHTTIRGASELRVKESDRIARTAEGLRRLGIRVMEHADGLSVEGGRPTGPARVQTGGDHRIAMAFTVAGLRREGIIEVDEVDSVRTSYPGFFEQLAELQA